MLVKERMSRHPITISPDVSLHDALRIMNQEKVRRLPVLDKKGKLVGIVLEKDLLYASPSPATSLSVYELNYLVSKITVEELMSREVITVEEDCPLEEAARIILEKKIGGLPVVADGKLAGVITVVDILTAFITMIGMLSQSSRLDVRITKPGTPLDEITRLIRHHRGEVISICHLPGQERQDPIYSVRLKKCDLQPIVSDLLDNGIEVVSSIP